MLSSPNIYRFNRWDQKTTFYSLLNAFLHYFCRSFELQRKNWFVSLIKYSDYDVSKVITHSLKASKKDKNMIKLCFLPQFWSILNKNHAQYKNFQTLIYLLMATLVSATNPYVAKGCASVHVD